MEGPSLEWGKGEGRPLRKGHLCRYQGHDRTSGPDLGGVREKARRWD